MNNVITKADLVDAIAEETGITKKQADKVFYVLTREIFSALREGDSVRFSPLGTFKTTERGPRSGVTNGVEWSKPAHRAPVFKPSSVLKERVAREA